MKILIRVFLILAQKHTSGVLVRMEIANFVKHQTAIIALNENISFPLSGANQLSSQCRSKSLHLVAINGRRFKFIQLLTKLSLVQGYSCCVSVNIDLITGIQCLLDECTDYHLDARDSLFFVVVMISLFRHTNFIHTNNACV